MRNLFKYAGIVIFAFILMYLIMIALFRVVDPSTWINTFKLMYLGLSSALGVFFNVLSSEDQKD